MTAEAGAAAAWQRLDDDRAAVIYGHGLLHLWERLDSHEQLSPEHVQLAERVRDHVAVLETHI